MRYALYYAPAPSSLLWQLGCRWLGRDAISGEKIRQDRFPGLEPDRLLELTHAPRRYGLHATIKAPFRLYSGCNEEMLRDAMDDFTTWRDQFTISPLILRQMDDFFCLCPERQTSELNKLAADCVRGFDGYRAPLSALELAHRRAVALNRIEKENLVVWGYPYVFDQFRFHISLTARIIDSVEKEIIYNALHELFAPILGKALTFDALSLFIEPSPRQPLYLADRFSLNVPTPADDDYHLLQSRTKTADSVIND